MKDDEKTEVDIFTDPSEITEDMIKAALADILVMLSNRAKNKEGK